MSTPVVQASAAGPLSVDPQDFAFISELARESAAIVLEPGKEYLVASRLTPLAQAEGLGSVRDLVSTLRGGGDNLLKAKVLEALCTNETSFFRDLHPFQALTNTVLPELEASRSAERRLRVWCAACSSGQEPYSIAMLLRQRASLSTWKIDLEATDFSSKILERAKEGRYSQFEVNRGLPAQMLVKFFQQQGAWWCVRDELRNMIRFRRMNLADPWSMPPLDIVFIRNVLIYFDTATKKQILARVKAAMKPDGYLFLGATETTIKLDDGFRREQSGKSTYYRLKS